MRQEIIWYPTLLSVKKYLNDIDIRAYDINIRALYEQVFNQVDYIYIRSYNIDIVASQGQVLVWVNNINIGAYNIDIGDYYIDVGASQVVFGTYNPNLLIDLALLSERAG